ncbi:hypothetical protein BJX70DRAFT_333401 [Aspergillus crustosus]
MTKRAEVQLGLTFGLLQLIGFALIPCFPPPAPSNTSLRSLTHGDCHAFIRSLVTLTFSERYLIIADPLHRIIVDSISVSSSASPRVDPGRRFSVLRLTSDTRPIRSGLICGRTRKGLSTPTQFRSLVVCAHCRLIGAASG